MTVTVDPLSQQIFNRTGEAPQATRQNSNDTTHSIAESERPRTARSPGPPPRTDTGSTRQIKSKEKGVSFLSRIIGKKKEHHELARDDASIAESRPEGHDAEIFSPITNDAEFNPAQPQAPDYIRIRTRHTKRKQFDTLFLAQELNTGVSEKPPPTVRRKSSIPEPPTVWAAEFSKDGKYLATAGHDKVIRVWAVLTTPEERQAEIRRNSGSSLESMPHPLSLTAQVFKSKPIKEYKGHSATILDLSWSKNNFLLSSSMDKTVRLWHVSRNECLCTFKHSDFVPSVSFHPKDDRFFLAGSLDCKIRMWSIPEKHVTYWHQTPEMVTAVSFTPDGKTVVAGSSNGLLTFYETEGLRYQTQIRAKSAHGRHSNGSKITGIQAFQHPLNSASGDIKLLVTTNDSRLRLYNFRDKSVEMKFKGCENNSSQLRGSISDDQKYICCGSEDSRAYIWPLDFEDHEDPTRRPLEHFQAHNSVVTCVRFAPTKSRYLLSKSCDPIYDLCNPSLPATREQRSPSQSSSRPPTDIGDATSAPLHRQSSTPTTPSLSKATHPGGNIIITCSVTGAIKVFRQDCAYRHRARLTRTCTSLSSRPNSIKTKSSNRSLRSGRDSTSTQAPSDRILSWRQ
ncbi:WD40-repeat-containing domain protein, partial [Elsinoe ampelina]